MAKRLTARDLKALGYEQRDGQWYAPNFSGSRPNAMSKPKPSSRRPASAKAKAKKTSEGNRPPLDKYFISVVARARRETDPDNLCAKWFIDCLIGAVIPDDSSRDIIGVLKSVEKIGVDEPEETIIEVWKV